MLGADQGMKALDAARFENRTAWTVADGAPTLSGYLLLSRFDGTRGRHVVDLVALATFETRHTWIFDADTLYEGSDFNERHASPDVITSARFRAIHPMLMEDGGLIAKNHDSPAVRVDQCGALVWRNDSFTFHHSTNRDAGGGVWIPTYAEPTPITEVSESYKDDGLARLNAKDGTVEEVISVTDMLIRHGLLARIFGSLPYDDDKIHLNDIEPVLADGPHWRKGDLLLSLRNLSAIALYRPSSGEVIWYKEGPWSGQHDVDVIDEHQIAAFDNGVYDYGKGRKVHNISSVAVHNLETGKTVRPWDDALAALDMRTASEGLFDMLPGGQLLVEEENNGRILILGANGALIAEYVNRADDGVVYRLGWSRVVDEASAASVLPHLKAKKCS